MPRENLFLGQLSGNPGKFRFWASLKSPLPQALAQGLNPNKGRVGICPFSVAPQALIPPFEPTLIPNPGDPPNNRPYGRPSHPTAQ